MSLLDAAREGDRLTTLEALRDKIAADLDACEPRETASLAGRLSDVLKQIAELGGAAKSKGTALDELNTRRAARSADAPRIAHS